MEEDRASAGSRRLAGLVGPALIAVSLSEAINLRIWMTPAPSILAPVVYLSGCLLFVAGLAIVRAHNRWTLGWPLIITVVGWLALAGGLLRMFLPTLAQQSVQGNHAVVLATLVVLLALGIVLTIKGRHA
jgi:hypothetical protein